MSPAELYQCEPPVEQRDSYTEVEIRDQTMDILVERDVRYIDEESYIGWEVAETAAISGTEALKA